MSGLRASRGRLFVWCVCKQEHRMPLALLSDRWPVKGMSLLILSNRLAVRVMFFFPHVAQVTNGGLGTFRHALKKGEWRWRFGVRFMAHMLWHKLWRHNHWRCTETWKWRRDKNLDPYVGPWSKALRPIAKKWSYLKLARGQAIIQSLNLHFDRRVTWRQFLPIPNSAVMKRELFTINQ